MKILHYTIGFSPERSGGLPLYAKDLMNEQITQGNQVFALYPGRINILRGTTYIKKNRRIVVPKVDVYELVNSLPVPLFGGIKTPDDFMRKIDLKVYKIFLDSIDVDVIHIHTLMGLHKEFFQAAKQKKIKIIYTSHDYFGISPVPDFYFNGKSWDEANTNEFWNKIAITAIPTWELRIFQLSLYPKIRQIVNKLRCTKKYLGNIKRLEFSKDTNTVDFSRLRNYYESIFEIIDFFHFNSNVAKEVYFKNIPWLDEKKHEVISITNSSISKESDSKKVTNSIKKIAYIGPYQENKGFYEFIRFAEIHKDSDYEFLTYGDDQSFLVPSYIINKGKYMHSELEKVFDSIDLVLVPSKWKETFSFITLEALSLGVEVWVSENVGAKLLLDQSKIFRSIEEITIPKKIKQHPILVKSIREHSDELIKIYESVVKND